MKKNFSISKIIFVTALAFLVTTVVITPLRQATQAKHSSVVLWPTVQLQQIASGFDRPVFIANANDESQRLFIAEQAGRIRIIQEDGSTLSASFLDIHEQVFSPANGGDNEQGLLSVAFSPDYAQSGIFYVYYTNLEGNNRVSRFHTSQNANLADLQSEQLIILFEHPGQTNHNGGQLAFGKDGYLYIGTGDGGGTGDPNGNAQNPASRLGKILRIDVAFPPGYPNKTYLPSIHNKYNTQSEPGAQNNENYRIPPDNPFANRAGYRPEIWALGMRNPWRFSFDHQTHDLWIADVGQGKYEEINFQAANSTGGENYGWNVMEGLHCYGNTTCNQSGLTLPIAEYDHSLGCSVTGGYIYRGASFPTLLGIYVYADFCSGRIWGTQNDNGWQSKELLNSGHGVSTFGEDENGELYLADMYSGEIYQVTASAQMSSNH